MPPLIWPSATMPQITAGSTMPMMPSTSVAIVNPLTGRCGWV